MIMRDSDNADLIKKRIAWVTSAGLVETDIHIVPCLLEKYHIDWYVIKESFEKNDFANELDELSKKANLNVKVVGLSGNRLGIGRIKAYRNLIKNFEKYDLIYSTIIGIPYYIPVLKSFVKKTPVIVAVHNVSLPKGVSYPLAKSLYQKYTYARFEIFDTFSKSQYQMLYNMLPKKKVYYTPFMLKDYGKPKKKRENEEITFLCYGTIKEYKRHDVVIKAAEALWEKGLRGYRVLIAGEGKFWKKCEPLIVHSDIFDLKIGRVKNEDIPELFNESDYLVLPYQGIAQSGAAIVGVNYELPIIASRLDSFMEYIDDGINGYLINPSDQKELECVMEKCVLDYNKINNVFRRNMKETKKNKFLLNDVIKAYTDMIENALG